MRELDVGTQPNPDAVGGFGRQVAQFGQPGAERLRVARAALVAGKRLFIGIDDHSAAIAVDDHTRRDSPTESRNGPMPTTAGSSKSLGDDRGVPAGAADLGAEPADVSAIQVRGFAGRQVVRQHDDRFGQIRERLAGSPLRVRAAVAFRCPTRLRRDRPAADCPDCRSAAA